MRYYSTQRPITPGSFPRVAFNAVKEIVNFERKTYCEEIGREAWGYIDYEKPLDRYDCNAYELTAVPTKPCACGTSARIAGAAMYMRTRMVSFGS